MSSAQARLILIQGEAINKRGGGNPVGALKGGPRCFPACVCSARSLVAERQLEFSEGHAREAQEEGKCCKYRKLSRGLDLEEVGITDISGSC